MVTGSGNVRTRIALGAGEMVIPLPAADDYNVTLRLDPFPRPLGDQVDQLPSLDVSLNDSAISTIPLRWTADRVGVYEVRLPRALVRQGANRLVLRLQDGSAFGLWYLRVQAASAKGGA